MDTEFIQKLRESRDLKYPLREDAEKGDHARWLRREVRQTGRCHAGGPGTIRRCENGSVYLTVFTSLPEKHPNNCYYALSIAKTNFAARDFTSYNRFSI